MSLTIEIIKEQVSNCFPDMQQVADSVICFTKKYNHQPYAIYYLDLTRELPSSLEELSAYQDKVIGNYYFKGQKSLQWNNYLYFIVNNNLLSKNEILQAKELIENNRVYARKFIIDEEKLDSILVPTKLSQNKSLSHESILSTWTNLLTEAGIAKAIFSKNNMPSRLKAIERASFKETKEIEGLRPNPLYEDTSFIKSLNINKYRKYPLNKCFEFGKVNLIVGPNGSGKTSLLESIELFYCGKNKRNLKNSIEYDISVIFEDGTEEKVSNNRDLALLRNRNLAWYGQSEINTWNIYQSFAKYNFLDTDAAISLANSTSNLEDDLSKLLVGPEAAEIWKTIERVYEALSSELKDLKLLISEIKGEITTLEKQIKIANSVQHESDLIYVRLEEMVVQLGWPVINTDKQSFSNSLVKGLPEMMGLIKEILSFNWLKASISPNELNKYCTETRKTIEKVEQYINQFGKIEKEKNKHLKQLNDYNEALNLLNQAENLIKAKVPVLIEKQSKEQEFLLKCNSMLFGLDESVFGLTKELNYNLSVAECCHTAISKSTEVTSILRKYKENYNNFKAKQDQLLNLEQELRQVASKILKESSHPDLCPLCHTQFEVGELVKQISFGINEQLETTAQSMLSLIRDQQEIVDKALVLESLVIWLKEYCRKANLGDNITLIAALSELDKTKKASEISQHKLEIITKKLSWLESQNLSNKSMDRIFTLLLGAGYRLVKFSKDEIEDIHKTIEQKIAFSSKVVDSNNKSMEEIQLTISEIINLKESDIRSSMNELSKMKEQLYNTEPIQKKLTELASFYPLSDKKAFDELFSELRSIRQMAVELQNAISKETQADKILQTSLNRKADIEPTLSDLLRREEKYIKALSVLRKIKEKHSLEAAMKSALQENRENIEKVFSNIHSPAEFKRVGTSWDSLIRKNGEEASLSQISTGQRAAFALSIFLAQNAQLKNAPPVILIDDPIAHIDDLNSLSFLDYMRDLALSNDRQIFFATANEKLASLFERKFDFLGEEFCRFNLKRSNDTD